MRTLRDGALALAFCGLVFTVQTFAATPGPGEPWPTAAAEETGMAPALLAKARVPKARIRERSAYEFLRSLDADGQPLWTADIRDRGAVFVNPGRCYRSGISYNAGLKRYLWCQTLPESTDPRGPRYQGGFGIYEAPEPWVPGARST